MDEERLARLEARLLRLEDELAITRLVASYGPLVDAGEAEAVAGLWADDGAYDVEGWQMTSRADIRAMVESDGHQGLIGGGCSHFLGPAHVHVDGDEAVAVCESLLVRHREGGYSVAPGRRQPLHVATSSPTAGGSPHRTTRALDGSAEARDLLS